VRSRNGLTGELVKKNNSSSLPVHYQPHRVRRTRLQSALKSKVPEGIIKLNKRLSSLEDLGSDGAKLNFEDGTEAIADLVIGGDGIRSVCRSFTNRKSQLTHCQVVREHVFPGHTIKFTG
jgi:salicylate hydroxylase